MPSSRCDSLAALANHPGEPATPYAFGQLLDRNLPQDIDLIFHIHVPKAGGRTVAALLRQNEFLNLDFEMNTQSFSRSFLRIGSLHHIEIPRRAGPTPSPATSDSTTRSSNELGCHT
jgi:hypothetical protein